MRKTIELLYAFSSSKRLNVFKDTLLCNRIPTIDFINLLNQDRLLLARNNVQQRTIQVLNESVYIQTDKGCLYSNDIHTRTELFKKVGELDVSRIAKLIPTMNTARLVSLIHAVTGEIPVIHATSNIQVSPSRFPHDIESQTPTTTTRPDTATIPVAVGNQTNKSKTDMMQR